MAVARKGLGQRQPCITESDEVASAATDSIVEVNVPANKLEPQLEGVVPPGVTRISGPGMPLSPQRPVALVVLDNVPGVLRPPTFGPPALEILLVQNCLPLSGLNDGLCYRAGFSQCSERSRSVGGDTCLR